MLSANPGNEKRVISHQGSAVTPAASAMSHHPTMSHPAVVETAVIEVMAVVEAAVKSTVVVIPKEEAAIWVRIGAARIAIVIGLAPIIGIPGLRGLRRV